MAAGATNMPSKSGQSKNTSVIWRCEARVKISAPSDTIIVSNESRERCRHYAVHEPSAHYITPRSPKIPSMHVCGAHRQSPAPRHTAQTLKRAARRCCGSERRLLCIFWGMGPDCQWVALTFWEDLLPYMPRCRSNAELFCAVPHFALAVWRGAGAWPRGRLQIILQTVA